MQLQHAIAAAGRVSQQPDKQIFVQNFTSISVMLMLSQANPGRKLGPDVQNAEILMFRTVVSSFGTTLRIYYIKLGFSHMHLRTFSFVADVHKATIAFIWLRTCGIAASMAQKACYALVGHNL